MIIVLQHPDHGTHIAYSDTEAAECEKRGWVRDPAMSRTMAGMKPELIDKSLAEQYREKFGKHPHHMMKRDTIEKALRE